MHIYAKVIKRIFDIFISLIALAFLSPVIIFCSVIIFLQDTGPIIFKQNRVGKDGLIFLIYKFRSMPVNTSNIQSSEAVELRITKFGKFMRRTNVDELPQLFNILKGDMSFVGPRPPIPTQANLVKLRKENGALGCLPGLTGWAQVNAYNLMSDERKALFDAEYAANITFFMDFKIILRTFLYLTKTPPTY